MNLAKKGTVLLAALSVFAMTSCGPQTKELTFEQALEWVKEHYKGTEERDVANTLVSWDYSKNEPNDTKLGQEFGPLANKGLNEVTQFSLNFKADVPMEDATESVKKDVKVDGTSAAGTWLEYCFNAEKFESEFKDEDVKAYATGNELKVVINHDYQNIDAVKLYFNEVQTLEIGSDGYAKKFTDTLTSDNMEIEIIGQPTTKTKLGKLNFTFTNVPVIA